ncbi:MAG: AAA family ATPase, partial [Venatoribacter sp.]
LASSIHFGKNEYRFQLEPTVDSGFIFSLEALYFDETTSDVGKLNFEAGRSESLLKESVDSVFVGNVAKFCYDIISSWKVFHFHDTSVTAGMKRWGAVHDNEFLRSDASNLAAYLYRLSQEHPDVLEEIQRTVRLGIPIFDKFVFKPRTMPTQEEQVNLQWQQKNSDYVLWPSQLSDGSIRFICLVTALLQPEPPSTIIIDEPELGLHPYAITLLGALLRSASKRMQVIVSTQSVPLVNEFEIEDLIVVDRELGDTVFKRLDEKDFDAWLEDYTVGELWQKNILGGRPS